MKFFDQIKNALSKSFLDTSPQENRKVKVTNFSQATSVGLIYKEKSESFYILVKQYVQYLKAEHGIRDVLAMAYVEDKHIPYWQVQKLEFEFFSKKDLDWRLKPTSMELDNFIAKDFDILIDLTLEPSPPLMYVLGKSRARFKVGAWSPRKVEILDLLVDLETHSTFDHYIKKLNHFLTILNKHNDPQPV